MKVSAIISEYNPFHNGHKFHIEKTRENGATHIVAIMSGDVCQRGSIAITDKHTRARLAVENGADLVVELPCPFSCSGAQSFAAAGVQIANELGVNELSFGAECDNLDLLFSASRAVEAADLTEALQKGLSYPAAIAASVKNAEYNEILSSPNNTLAIEYIRLLHGTKISPFAVKRHGAMHDSRELVDGFASASEIRRRLLCNETVDELLPYNANFEIADIRICERGLLYLLRSLSREDFICIPDCSISLGSRIFEALKTSDSLNTLYDKVKAKCCTHARIRRIVLFALLGVRKEDFLLQGNLPYIRLLAMNYRGKEILSMAKNTKIPIGASLCDLERLDSNCARLAYLDERASQLLQASMTQFKGFTSEKTKKFIFLKG